MGQDNSKASPELSQHVFKASGPQTTYSGDLVESLHNSVQTDKTRDANLELIIQQRVTSELERLAKEEEGRLESAAESASTDAENPSATTQTSPSLKDKITGEAKEKERRAQLSSGAVAKEIAELKKKLEGRKKLEKPDAGVERAKEELVQCLRMNDRRPLDCWQERENFKREVGRLEREFVERTVR